MLIFIFAVNDFCIIFSNVLHFFLNIPSYSGSLGEGSMWYFFPSLLELIAYPFCKIRSLCILTPHLNVCFCDTNFPVSYFLLPIPILNCEVSTAFHFTAPSQGEGEDTLCNGKQNIYQISSFNFRVKSAREGTVCTSIKYLLTSLIFYVILQYGVIPR